MQIIINAENIINYIKKLGYWIIKFKGFHWLRHNGTMLNYCRSCYRYLIEIYFCSIRRKKGHVYMLFHAIFVH